MAHKMTISFAYRLQNCEKSEIMAALTSCKTKIILVFDLFFVSFDAATHKKKVAKGENTTKKSSLYRSLQDKQLLIIAHMLGAKSCIFTIIPILFKQKKSTV